LIGSNQINAQFHLEVPGVFIIRRCPKTYFFPCMMYAINNMNKQNFIFFWNGALALPGRISFKRKAYQAYSLPFFRRMKQSEIVIKKNIAGIIFIFTGRRPVTANKNGYRFSLVVISKQIFFQWF